MASKFHEGPTFLSDLAGKVARVDDPAEPSKMILGGVDQESGIRSGKKAANKESELKYPLAFVVKDIVNRARRGPHDNIIMILKLILYLHDKHSW